MSRVDRVLDLLDFLRSHEIVTVAEIAAGLGVGRRTVLRDLATLRGRGWPIRAESGPGGGVYLDRGRGVATVHLDTEGIVALWVASKLSASATRLPWSSAPARPRQDLRQSARSSSPPPPAPRVARGRRTTGYRADPS